MYLNGIKVHELISLRFNMNIGAGKGDGMGGHAGMPVWDTGHGVLMQLWDIGHTVLSLILSRTDHGVALFTVQGLIMGW